MSSRPWHTPQKSEILEPTRPSLESVAIAAGLAILIVSVKLWRAIFGKEIDGTDYTR